MSDYLNKDNNQPRGNNRTIFYVLLLLLLLGLNIYLYLRYSQRTNQAAQLTEKVSTDSVRIGDLTTKFQEAQASIESYKGQNAELDSIVAVKVKALQDLQNSYAGLQHQSKIAKADFDKQVANLNSIVQDLQSQIAKLEAENKLDKTTIDSLNQSLVTQVATNTQLNADYQAATKKVAIGSLLRPANIKGTGIKVKGSGKESETDNAKKASELKICWDVPENAIATAGDKIFYVRIISPEGTTLGTQSDGSGVFNSADDGKPIQYTTSATVNYDDQSTNACATWTQTNPFNKGTYSVKIYQDGYLVGSSDLVLK